jgi:hypothetical protein
MWPPALPPDSSIVDQALIDRLLGDAQLKAICPDGVWWEVGDEKSQRFVVVSIVDHDDVPVFGGRAWENTLYLVKAVMLNSAGGSVRAAAARIDSLLENWNSDLPDFGHLSAHREGRIRITEQDSENSAIRWLHRGGRYRVHAAIA